MHDRLKVRARGQVPVRVVERDVDDVLGPHVAQRLALALDVDRAPVRPADAGVAQGEVLLAEPGDDPAGQHDLPDRIVRRARWPRPWVTHRRSVGGYPGEGKEKTMTRFSSPGFITVCQSRAGT